MAEETAGGCGAPTAAFLAQKGSETLWELQFANCTAAAAEDVEVL